MRHMASMGFVVTKAMKWFPLFVVLLTTVGGAMGIPSELENIPLIKEQFYIGTVAQLLIYLDIFVLLLSLVLIVVGSLGGGDRPEAAGTYMKGKKLFYISLLVLFLLGALQYIVEFVLEAGGEGGDVNVPEW